MSDVLPLKNLGVINSLNEGYVEVKFEYELIRPELPLRLRIVYDDDYKDMKVLVPHRAFSPYDQRATLHFQSVLWALLLPVTIQQSVSDIFRSYVMQVKTSFPFHTFDKSPFYILNRD
jgi:hypothetical protein